MPTIKLCERGPTRSAPARWALLEGVLTYGGSAGNQVEIMGGGDWAYVSVQAKLIV